MENVGKTIVRCPLEREVISRGVASIGVRYNNK